MKIGTLVLGLVIGLGVGAAATALAEKQPHMEKALEHLEHAKAQLQKAEHDRGGHRAKAVELTNQAMTEVRAGMAFDDKNPRK